jgi:hypothetical protein
VSLKRPKTRVSILTANPIRAPLLKVRAKAMRNAERFQIIAPAAIAGR